jgi:predicted acylesterase/phospholipase RssA
MIHGSESAGYSSERRTALVLSGTGADGAYHAGVLRALHEIGIKLDLIGGRGVGALGAVLHAIDGAAPLWDAGGVWRGESADRMYRWRWPFRWLSGLTIALVAILAVPLAVLLISAGVYPLALGLGMAGLSLGSDLARFLLEALGRAFGPGALPTWIPRAVLAVAVAGLGALAVGALLERRRRPGRRTAAGPALWTLLGAPIEAAGAVRAATSALWGILKGGAALRAPDARDLSRRYADLLTDNLGHPGFRELLVVAHDLDARRDVVFGLLKEPYRKALFAAVTATSARRAEAHDLAGVARDHLVDALAAALALPGSCQPRLVTFGGDTFWRGETHRLVDRTASLGRLLEEVAAAGAEQLILVSAAPDPAVAHGLRPTRDDVLGQIGEHLASAESAALTDAVRHLQHRFHATYVIRPSYNPLRPMDLAGAFDERSDRHHALGELVERGYEDAYRQFIEPVLGDSGERIQDDRNQDPGFRT